MNWLNLVWERLRGSDSQSAQFVLSKALKILVAAATITLVLLQFEFSLLEANLYDFRVKYSFQFLKKPNIAIISLDDQTVKGLDDFAPLALEQHAAFLEQLHHYSPKAIGYLVNLNYVNQVDPSQFESEPGDRFLEAVQKYKTRKIPFLIGTPFDVNGEVVPPYPLSSIDHSIAVIHKDGNVFSDDEVTRRALLRLYQKPTFHLELAKRTGMLSSDLPRGAFYVPEIDGEYFFFRYSRDTRIDSKDTYPTYSFIDVLENRVPKEALNNKIVLVSSMMKENPSDFTRTPFSTTLFNNPKAWVHANIIDSIIENNGVLLTPAWINALFVFVLSGFVLWFVLTSTPLAGVFTTLGLTLFFLIISQILFSYQGIWIREGQPLIAIFLSYYLAVPYRLIREYKRRWKYQEQNQLLKQVEELKTNFLSLVTHDLKTPVARIQGLAEVLLRNERKHSKNQEKNLNHIIDSTEELNHFITSMLELTKIESKAIRIHLESKDINQLIEKAILSLEPQAQAKGIRINLNLEPLFPIKLDGHLILKVIINLIDNAIKYSPNQSEILVESIETDEHVVVSVSDHGIGLTETEKEQLFTRFYRAKNDLTTRTPGTGLGLYLTKYFVEMHLGEVQVSSSIGHGSKFEIVLPKNLTNEAIVSEGKIPGLKTQKPVPDRTLNQKIKQIISKTFANTKEKRHV